MLFSSRKSHMIDAEHALPGRDTPMPVPARHEVLGTPIAPPFPEGLERMVVGMGCFWGAERIFWQAEGVYTTAVGYAGGFTPNPSYEEVCSAGTGHAEVVLVVFDPSGHLLRGDAAPVLGGPRPDAGHAPGQRRRHPVPVRPVLDDRGPAHRRARLARDLPAAAHRRAATARSRPRSPRRGRSTTPRSTTSSTSPRTRTGTAGSAAPASAARSDCLPSPRFRP